MGHSGDWRPLTDEPPRPGRHARAANPARKVSIPIVDQHGHIVGWTDTSPVIRGAALYHPDAERLIGEDFLANYIRIEDPDEAARAGAPAGWRGAWRCLAVCSARLPTRNGDPVVPVVRTPRHL